MGDDKIYSCDVRNDPSQRKVLHMKRGEGLTEGKRRRPGSQQGKAQETEEDEAAAVLTKPVLPRKQARIRTSPFISATLRPPMLTEPSVARFLQPLLMLPAKRQMRRE